MWIKTENELINTDNVTSIEIDGDDSEYCIRVTTDTDCLFLTSEGTKEDCQALLDRIQHSLEERVRVLDITL